MPDSTAPQRTPESLISGFYIVASMLPDGPKPPPQRKTTPGGLLPRRSRYRDRCLSTFLRESPARGHPLRRHTERCAKDTLKKAENATVGRTKPLIFCDLELPARNFSVF